MSIFFWSNQKFSKFSNFSKTPFILDGKLWDTVEHYFQAMKTTDTLIQEQIRLSDTPKKAKNLGRRVNLRSDWESIRYQIMLKALRAKFSDKYLRDLLLSTEDETIYEDSPYDAIWGTGVKNDIGQGQNLLGKALMQIREELKKEEVPTLF